MPNFLDFLLAPWKILEFLAMPAKPGSPSLTAALPAGGFGLCSVQEMAGQLNYVCNVAGYEMPRFVFWASAGIILLFLLSSAALLLQCYKISRVLARVNRALRWVSDLQSKKMTEEELTKIRAVMMAETLLAQTWLQFEDGLISTLEGDEIYATEPIAQAFSRAAVIDDNIHSALFNAIPGIITGLGLLMTFVAILDGLSHVTVTANMDVTGISGLINGLSGKFVSSIAAVSCAVSFVFVERIGYGLPNQRHRRLVALLSSRFKRRTTEHLLFTIQNQLLAQAARASGSPAPQPSQER